MISHVSYKFKLPSELFNWLENACEEAKEKGEKANSQLVGHIKEEYYINNFPQNFVDFLLQCASSNGPDKHLAKVNCLSADRPLYLHTLWVNYMKKHEFNPPHNHSGVLSFVIFVKIPYDLKDEENQFPVKPNGKHPPMQNHTSKFTFLNTGPDGSILINSLKVDKTYEGNMLMFPSAQMHEVFPFYTSDAYRVTVSGNLRLKV